MLGYWIISFASLLVNFPPTARWCSPSFHSPLPRKRLARFRKNSPLLPHRFIPHHFGGFPSYLIFGFWCHKSASNLAKEVSDSCEKGVLMLRRRALGWYAGQVMLKSCKFCCSWICCIRTWIGFNFSFCGTFFGVYPVHLVIFWKSFGVVLSSFTFIDLPTW